MTLKTIRDMESENFIQQKLIEYVAQYTFGLFKFFELEKPEGVMEFSWGTAVAKFKYGLFSRQEEEINEGINITKKRKYRHFIPKSICVPFDVNIEKKMSKTETDPYVKMREQACVNCITQLIEPIYKELSKETSLKFNALVYQICVYCERHIKGIPRLTGNVVFYYIIYNKSI